MKSQQWRILKNPHLFIARAYGERTVPVLLLINIFPKQQQQQPQNNNKTEFRMRWSSWVIFLFGWIKIMIRQIVYHNQISWLCKVDVNLLVHLIKKKKKTQDKQVVSLSQFSSMSVCRSSIYDIGSIWKGREPRMTGGLPPSSSSCFWKRKEKEHKT